MPDHSVHIRIHLSEQYGTEQQRQHVLSVEDKLRVVVSASGVGKVDGHGFGFELAELFLYGPDADQLYSTIEPLLRAAFEAHRVEVTLMYGSASDPEVREVTFNLSAE